MAIKNYQAPILALAERYLAKLSSYRRALQNFRHGMDIAASLSLRWILMTNSFPGSSLPRTPAFLLLATLSSND